MFSRLLVAACFLVLLALPAAAGAQDAAVLKGTVGPGFDISLVDAAGADVKNLDPGTYRIDVNDLSGLHSFHLLGPGVDQATEVPFEGQATWTVTFAVGTYKFLCDAHPTTMRGSFTVGTPPLPKPTRLAAQVGPGARISLAARAKAGRYAIVVRDLTAKDNFHLTGRGVNRKTGIKFKGTVTWAVTLAAGKYRYRSDAHPGRSGTLVVT
jgi:plastocyanin